jgi:hypothetical protein
VLLAASVASVTVQQWWLSRETLRFNLFEKRYAVFAAARAFVARLPATPIVRWTRTTRFGEALRMQSLSSAPRFPSETARPSGSPSHRRCVRERVASLHQLVMIDVIEAALDVLMSPR